MFDQLFEWGTVALAITGIFAVLGLVDRAWRDRSKESDAAEDRLRELYKEEISQLQTRLEGQDDKISKLEGKYNHLLSENKILKDLIMDKDEASNAHRQRVIKILNHTTETIKMMEVQNQHIEKIYEIIKNHIVKE